MKFPGFVLFFLLHSSCLALDVVAPRIHNALIGSTTVVPCSFTVNSPPIDTQFLAILWQYGEKEFVRYDNKEKSASPRMSIDEEEARKGNASLTIHNVTISDQGTYKCLVIYSPSKGMKEIQLNTQAAPQVTLMKKALSKNRKNRLLCLVTNFYPKDITVTWLRNGQPLNGPELGPSQMDADGTYKVNSSVTISPHQDQDHPTITCQVDHVSLPEPIKDASTIQYGAEPEITFFSSRDGDKEVFVCEVKEFYPEDLKITWLLDGKRMEPSRRNANGTYNKWDHFLMPGNHKRGGNITCVVEHETLESPMMKTLTVTDEKDISRIIIYLLATILGINIVMVSALFYKIKYFQRFQLSPIHIRWNGNRDGKVTMCCTASNCLEKIQVIWTVAENNEEMKMVNDPQTQGDGERGQLLSGDYTVRTDQSETDRLYNAITSLTFTPNVAKHCNTRVTCSFLSGSKTKEVHNKWSFNVLRPHFSAPMMLSLDNSGDVVCSVALEKFCPKDIQIKWSCGVGNYQELDNVKMETLNNHSENTFNCTSKCHVPKHLFQDAGFRVRVIWTHVSLDQPESQEVSSKDLPWRPVMGDITIQSTVSFLVHGREARMQCGIWGYFPDNLEVKWLRREAGKPELYEVSSSDKYKIPIMEVTQEPDKTYTCIASLIVSISAKTDHGAEIICRVAHPSLETHLEKRTGELTVKGKPVIRKTQHIGKCIVLEVVNFSTQDLTVTWEKAFTESGPYMRMEEEFIQNIPTKNSDFSFSFTSKCEIVHLVNVKDKYFRAIIEHGALNTPEVIVFLHSGGNVYNVSGKEKKLLEQVNQDNNSLLPFGNPFDAIKKLSKPNVPKDKQDDTAVEQNTSEE